MIFPLFSQLFDGTSSYPISKTLQGKKADRLTYRSFQAAWQTLLSTGGKHNPLLHLTQVRNRGGEIKPLTRRLEYMKSS